MKILLLGSKGQLGQTLYDNLSLNYDVCSVSRSELDLVDGLAVQNFLQNNNFDIIVNAAAYTNVDKAEEDREIAVSVNANLPKLLAEYSHKNSCLLIHYSTDYVFDGCKRGPYAEDDFCSPINFYGYSKRLGEESIINNANQYIIFRTSWVFSAHGNNFLNTILKLAKERDNLNIISDQFGVPTSVNFLSEITLSAIDLYLQKKLIYGMYHASSSGITTWFDYANFFINKAKNYGMQLKIQNINPIKSIEYNAKAKRPMYSCLFTEKFAKNFAINIPVWQDEVDFVVKRLSEIDLI